MRACAITTAIVIRGVRYLVQDMASKLVREQVERTRQRASQASLVVRDLSDRGLFPGVYAQELELFRANNRKTWFSAAGVGLGIYLGLFPVIPRRVRLKCWCSGVVQNKDLCTICIPNGS